MRLIVDVMSGDHAPAEIVKGCVDAASANGVALTLVGNEKKIAEELSKLGASKDSFEIIPASEVITMEDAPVAAIKKKNDSSMVRGLSLLRQEPDSVFISAGNTGALMVGGLLKVGRIKGIDRPALAPVMPNMGRGTLLIDAGANTECKPENLVQFARMGAIYMEKVLGRVNPKVGLVNIGAEESKGSDLYKAAYTLLKEAPGLNFTGNVEARDIPEGMVDVMVCDGFTGNILLKYTEGLALTLFSMLKAEMLKTPVRKIGAMLLKPGLKEFKNRLDYAEYGGAPLLGINGGIIKAHGSSRARAVQNAIRQGKLFMEKQVLQSIRDSIPEN